MSDAPTTPFSIPKTHQDENKAPLLLGLTTSLALSALFVFALRIYTRLRPVFRLGWDDYAIILAVIFGIAQYVVLILNINVGVGRHIEYTYSTNNLIVLGKLGFVSAITWGWSITFTKVSIAFMMLRINLGRIWQWSMRGMIAFLLILATVTMVLQCTQCRPMSGIWDPFQPGVVCRSPAENQLVIYVPSALQIVTDFIFALLPLTFIVGLRRPLVERIVLAFILGLGLFASAAGIAKMVLLKEILITRDPTWDLTMLFFWSLAELYVGIFAACIPCLKSFLEATFRRFGSSISSKLWSTGADQSDNRGAIVGGGGGHQLKSFTESEEQKLSLGSNEHTLHSSHS